MPPSLRVLITRKGIVIDIVDNTPEKLGEVMTAFYNRALMNAATRPSPLFDPGEIIGYEDVRVPVWFKIKVPVIDWSYKEYDEYGYDSEPVGILISFKEVKLFKICSKIEKET